MGPTNEWSQSREEIYRRIEYKAGVSVTVNIRVKGSNFASVFSGTNDAHINKVSFIL